MCNIEENRETMDVEFSIGRWKVLHMRRDAIYICTDMSLISLIDSSEAMQWQSGCIALE